MKHFEPAGPQKVYYSRILRHWALLGLLALAGPALAQNNCLLVPVPLAERLARAAWVVEAQAQVPQAVRDAQGHLLTRYPLVVFKVFRGPAGVGLPAAVLLAGGTLGTQREVVSSSPDLAPGQQGVFFLEPDPQHAGEWRLFAGPQGLIGYDLQGRTATEPFAAYRAIEKGLYPALRDPAQAAGYRLVQANAALAAPEPARQAAAVAAVSGFSPASVMAGTGAVLTIAGSGFGASQGAGTVQFLNANNGGGSRVRPLAADYVSWTDTRIEVRVPSTTLEGGPAGSGTVLVTDNAGASSTSSAALAITYVITNLDSGGPPLRPKLSGDNGAGGYTLAYGPTLQANPNATAAFGRANTQWACKTGANRITTTTASTALNAADNINIVAFDDPTTPTLPMGVLGITYSYYSGCAGQFTLAETDYVFANRADWNFGDHTLVSSEYDFESVALHELGHGIQLGHVINSAAVMHYSISNGQNKRTLGTTDDLPGGRDEVQFSTTTNTTACGPAVPPHQLLVLPGCRPLPVQLVLFAARYATGRGTIVAWATAAERNSAYFAVEAQEEGATAWREVARQPAAGTSTTARTYEAHDPRLLSGTRYYRLRQADADGRTSYSPVVAVASTEPGLALYPNPVADRLQVSGPAHAGQLLLRDLAGRAVARFVLVPGPNEVNVASLHPGFYLVEWTDGLITRRGRLQKQ